MRFANNPDTKNFLGVAETICSDFVSRKSGVFDLSKTRSPGRFPEGKVWFPGRFPGSLFQVSTFLFPSWTSPGIAARANRRGPNHGIRE